jgi:ABC-type uncharacterized transport system substrate-binding protein
MCQGAGDNQSIQRLSHQYEFDEMQSIMIVMMMSQSERDADFATAE